MGYQAFLTQIVTLSVPDTSLSEADIKPPFLIISLKKAFLGLPSQETCLSLNQAARTKLLRGLAGRSYSSLASYAEQAADSSGVA
ncbi:hypothetical protein R5M92_12775 [Halomonas sp. Bachu 37]|uniref:hypothetical protein n=1 Tax=Halomonas kashgarensis TaxID=3084920 RepID=UPI0032163500